MKVRGTPAISIGVVYDRATRMISRVINPTFEEELDLHPMTDGEYMLRVSKAERGVSTKPDGMSLDDLHRLVEVMQ
jgi:hypothetical protein